MDIKTISQFFEANPSIDGYSFSGKLVPSETPVLQLQVAFNNDDLPVYITVTEQQILCIVYLWQDSEIKPESRAELMESMLELNIPMPLSSFARTGEHTVMFGALHNQSTEKDILHEVITLHDNALEAVEALSEYLV